MSVTLADVRHIAALARLGLSDDRASALVAELNTILGHMEVLEQVDTTGLAEVAGIGAAGMPLRPDGGEPLPMGRAREEFAPRMEGGFFLVPRLSTHEDAEASS